jgi:hypothetical protein
MKIKGSEIRDMIREEMAKSTAEQTSRPRRQSRSRQRTARRASGARQRAPQSEASRRNRVDEWLDREIRKEDLRRGRVARPRKKGDCGCSGSSR